MKIDVTAQILDIDDQALLESRPRFDAKGDPVWLNPEDPFKDRVQAADRFPLTLRTVIRTAMQTVMKGDDELEGEEKAKLSDLAFDTRSDVVEWTPEQVSMVRARIGKGYGPVVVGPAFKLLG